MMATRELREKTLLEAGEESVASRRAALGSALPVSSSRVNIRWMEKTYQLLNHCSISPALNFMQSPLYTLLVFTYAFLKELNVSHGA